MPDQQSEGAQRPGCRDQPATADEPPPSPRSASIRIAAPGAPADAATAGPVIVAVRAESHRGPAIDLAWIESNLVRAVERLAEGTGATADAGQSRERSPRTRRFRVPREIDVRIVGDGRMRELHARHCGLDSTTDVLTFPGDLDELGGPSRVDIAVCRDEAARRADASDRPVEPELLLYALHGVLHCLGYDDHEPDDYALMHEEEDRILKAIGVGPVFRAPVAASRAEDAASAAADATRSVVESSPQGGGR
ncbi:MAG: rRNA maturation RNase YbeY [Phycisphaerales bacterium]|nr:rRNA maturation RNase YbeY [Phycisphaerales bacterium]